MVAYLDSSVLLRHILLGDSGIEHVFAVGRVISSELLEIECNRVLHRYRLQNDLDDDGYIEASNRLEHILNSVSIIRLSPKVKKRSKEAFPVIIKTLDALHLSSALIFHEARQEESLLIFSYDIGMNRCAKSLGFAVPFE
jgi:PIN domain